MKFTLAFIASFLIPAAQSTSLLLKKPIENSISYKEIEQGKCLYVATWSKSQGGFVPGANILQCINPQIPCQVGNELVADYKAAVNTIQAKPGCHPVGKPFYSYYGSYAKCYKDCYHNQLVIKFNARIAKSCLLVCDCDGGTGGGEPHIKPWNSQRYYFMGECDTVFHTSELMDIHIRTAIEDFYSIITATAIRVGDSVLEMEMGNTHKFWVNGQEFSDDDLPMQIEGKYTLQLGDEPQRGEGTNYELKVDLVTVTIRSMKLLMAVDFNGYSEKFAKGTGGLIGKYPNGELLGRDGVTVFEYDGVAETANGFEEPINNAMGQEWQVRDTDPQLFRMVQEPAFPNKCAFPTKTSTQANSRRRLSSSVDIDAASKACQEKYEQGTDDFEFCIMDVLMLDDTDAAYSW